MASDKIRCERLLQDMERVMKAITSEEKTFRSLSNQTVAETEAKLRISIFNAEPVPT